MYTVPVAVNRHSFFISGIKIPLFSPGKRNIATCFSVLFPKNVSSSADQYLCMKLFYRQIGSGPPLILLHGLWGASENWLPVAHRLSPYFRVILPDLRNHGRSPHAPDHTYESMAGDLRQFIEELNLPVKPHLAGHSMGGKVVMTLLLKKPDIALKSIIIDIAPIRYALREEHERLFCFIHTANLSGLHTTEELKKRIGSYFPSEKEQQILLKNIRKEKEGFNWKINAEVLYNSRYSLCEWPEELQALKYEPELLFIKGENSPYLTDRAVLKNNFPAALLSVVPEAGHWLHTEQPEKLSALITAYLKAEI